MKILLVAASVAACQPDTAPIVEPPPPRTACSSQLLVPHACPIYAPGDSDDNDEPPFPEHIAAECVVDDTGATYGTATGDQGPGLAVIPGEREIGVYIAFNPAFPPDLHNLTVIGSHAAFKAYAAPDRVDSYSGSCCPEDTEHNRIPLSIVALGPTGILLTLGHFDDTRTQVEISLDHDKAYPGQHLSVLWNDRFYINGAP